MILSKRLGLLELPNFSPNMPDREICPSGCPSRVIDSGGANPTLLAHGRYIHGLIRYKDFVYSVGGHNAGSGVGPVERCTIDKTTGNLKDCGVTGYMAHARWHAEPVLVGNRIYIWGGHDGGINLEAAELASDGSMQYQTFRPLGRSLGTWAQTAALVGDKLYKIGGWVPGRGYIGDVEQATVFPGGGISPFRYAGSLVLPRAHFNLVRVGDFLYAIGGNTSTGPSQPTTTAVERAQIQPDGSLGAFAAVLQSLVLPRVFPSSFVAGDYLYVTGGHTSQNGAVYDTVERAAIRADGSLGDFEIYPAARMRTPRYAHGSAVIGDWCYVIGGNVGGPHTTRVDKARIGPGGDIGPFEAAPDLPLAYGGTEAGAAQVVGSYLYVFGAHNGSVGDARVIRAPIGAGGDLGPWEIDSGSALNRARWHHSVVVGDGTVFALGGHDGGAVDEGRAVALGRFYL